MNARKALSSVLVTALLLSSFGINALPVFAAGTQRTDASGRGTEVPGAHAGTIATVTLDGFRNMDGDEVVGPLEIDGSQLADQPIDRLAIPGTAETLPSNITLTRPIFTRSENAGLERADDDSIRTGSSARESVTAMAAGINQGNAIGALNRFDNKQSENGEPILQAITADSLGGDGSDLNRGGPGGNGGSSDDNNGSNRKGLAASVLPEFDFSAISAEYRADFEERFKKAMSSASAQVEFVKSMQALHISTAQIPHLYFRVLWIETKSPGMLTVVQSYNYHVQIYSNRVATDLARGSFVAVVIPAGELLRIEIPGSNEQNAANDKVALPVEQLVSAAQSLRPMTGPGYSVTARLRGTSIAGQLPNENTETVELEIDGKTVQVQDPGAILAAVKGVRPPTLHYYEFEGTVEISAIAREFPPYTTSTKATLSIGYAGARRPQWFLSERGISPIFTQAMKDRLAADPRIRIVNASLMRVTVEAEPNALDPYRDLLNVVRVASDPEKAELSGAAGHPVGALPPWVEQQRRKAIQDYLNSVGIKDFQVNSYADTPSHVMSGANVASIKTGPQHAFRVGQIYKAIQDGLKSGKLKAPFTIWEIAAGDRTFRDQMPQSTSIVTDAAKIQELLGKIKDPEIPTYSHPVGVPPFAGAWSFEHAKISDLKPELLGEGGWVLHERAVKEPNQPEDSTSARDYYLEWTGAVASSLEAEVQRHAERLADHHAEIVSASAATAAVSVALDAAPVVAIDHRTVPVPNDYHRYSAKSGAQVLRKNEDNGNSVSYRTAGGLEVPLNGSSKYAGLVRSGALTMYQVRTKDGDGEGHTVTDTSYVLAVRGRSALKRYAPRLDSLIEAGRAAWDKHQKAVDSLHNVIHASRIASGRPDDAEMARIKEQVRTAVAQFAAIEQDYQKNYASLQDQARALVTEIKGPSVKALISDALQAADPQSYDSYQWKEQAKWISAVQAIDAVIYEKPEIRYVDPSFRGVRIGLDVKPIVEAGGSAAGLADQLKAQMDALLKQKKIDVEISVELLYGNSDLDRSLFTLSQKLAREIMAPIIGADAIRGFGSSGYDSDSKGWWEIRVKPEAAEAAKGLLPKIKAEMARYGFRSFAENVIIAKQDDKGTITEDEKMPAGSSAAGWGFDAEAPAHPSTQVTEFVKLLTSRPQKADRREDADHSKHGVSMSPDGKSIVLNIEEPQPGSNLASVISIGVDIESGKTSGSARARNTAGGPSPMFVRKLSDDEAAHRASSEMSAWIHNWMDQLIESVVSQTHVTAEMTEKLVQAFKRVETNGTIEWTTSRPVGEHLVQVHLEGTGFGDQYIYSALIATGPVAPNAPTRDPNKATSFLLMRSGGQTAATVYSTKWIDIEPAQNE